MGDSERCRGRSLRAAHGLRAVPGRQPAGWLPMRKQGEAGAAGMGRSPM